MVTIDLADRSQFKRRMNSVLTIDPARTVALTVDMQREYLDETVGHSVVEPAEAERVLASAAAFLAACRERGVPVVHVYAVRRPEEIDSGFEFGGLAYLAAGNRINESQLPHRPVSTRPDRVLGSPESEVPQSLVEPEDLHVTSKKSLDGFADTELGFLLERILGARYVLITGVNTDTCVYSTTFSAANRGYWPVVVSDCVASMRGVDSHQMALELMSRSIAWVLTAGETLERFTG